MTHPKRLPVVVLISGNGSNLQAFIDGQRDGWLPIDIRAVISNRANAYGLQRAVNANIPTRVLSHKDYPGRNAYDEALRRLIDGFQPGLVILAGFMRILGQSFVAHYEGMLLNIHPSLLPAYRGLHTHERVLADGASSHGCSVHFVNADLDAGPIIAQGRVAVLPGDTAEVLAARVQHEEHRIYPLAVKWFAEGRLSWRPDGVYFDDRRQTEPVILDQEQSVDP